MFPSYKLQPFILHITNLGLGHQHPAVQRKRGDVSGDLPRVLLRFEGQNDLIVCVRDKFEGGEAVSWVERTDALHQYGAEICGARQHEVGGAPLVCCLVVTLVAGTAREEEPALEPLAPCRRLVDEVSCKKEKGCEVLVGLLVGEPSEEEGNTFGTKRKNASLYRQLYKTIYNLAV